MLTSLSLYTRGDSSFYLFPAQKIIRLNDVFTSYVYKTYCPKSGPIMTPPHPIATRISLIKKKSFPVLYITIIMTKQDI